jgi:hypothetical protein
MRVVALPEILGGSTQQSLEARPASQEDSQGSPSLGRYELRSVEASESLIE